jgi:hypothetical protein
MWLFLSVVVVMGFLILKLRRRRKAKQAGTGYYDSKAA